MNLLSKLLAKRGLTKQELEGEEKEQFETWERVLSKEELTIKDLKQFLSQQVGLIEAKWRDYSISEKKKAELIAYHTVYKAIMGAIDAPIKERSALEQYLINLINK